MVSVRFDIYVSNRADATYYVHPSSPACISTPGAHYSTGDGLLFRRPLDLGHSPLIMGGIASRRTLLDVRFAVLPPAILCQRGFPRTHACLSAGFLLKPPLNRTACPVFPPSDPWYTHAS